MVTFSFLYPKFLWFLLLVPLFILIYFFSIAYNKKKSIVFSNFEAMQRFYDMEFFSKNFLTLYINIGIIVLLVFALAGTSVVFTTESSSYSYVVAVDNSWSMQTSDMDPNRLSVAKSSAKRFLELLPVGTEAGVLSFSGDAKIMQPVTSSKVKNKIAIDSIDFGEIGGTNIYNAILVANRMLGEDGLNAIILMSDGQLNAVDAPQVIDYAKKKNLVVHTIAIGTREGGKTSFETISKTDEEFLKSIAFNTEGKFFSAQDMGDLDESFNEIVYKTQREVSMDLAIYFLIAALLLFAFEWAVHNLRFKIFS